MHSTVRLLSASTLTNNPVVNPRGEKLGRIEEFMLDLESGRVAYAVLSFGGFLGLGDKLFAVPWAAMKLDTEKHEFVLDVSKETLKESHGFDKDHWPDLADLRVGSDIHRRFKVPPYWES